MSNKKRAIHPTTKVAGILALYIVKATSFGGFFSVKTSVDISYYLYIRFRRRNFEKFPI